MWAWIYEGAIITVVPIVNGCDWEWALYAAWNSMWGTIGGCWVDGWTVHVLVFTLQ